MSENENLILSNGLGTHPAECHVTKKRAAFWKKFIHSAGEFPAADIIAHNVHQEKEES